MLNNEAGLGFYQKNGPQLSVYPNTPDTSRFRSFSMALARL